MDDSTFDYVFDDELKGKIERYILDKMNNEYSWLYRKNFKIADLYLIRTYRNDNDEILFDWVDLSEVDGISSFDLFDINNNSGILLGV